MGWTPEMAEIARFASLFSDIALHPGRQRLIGHDDVEAVAQPIGTANVSAK
jgi:hypothetical protein